jgi:hypothetical protein
MPASPHRRFSYANVMATLAILISLGGSAYAAVTITGANVRDASLTGRDIKDGSLSTNDIHDLSLLAKDFKAGQIPAGPQGPPGKAGAQGLPGPQGAPGESGANQVTRRATVTMIPANTDVQRVNVPCQGGEVAVGGGWEYDTGTPTVLSSFPEISTGWTVEFLNQSMSPQRVAVWAVCAS